MTTEQLYFQPYRLAIACGGGLPKHSYNCTVRQPPPALTLPVICKSHLLMACYHLQQLLWTEFGNLALNWEFSLKQ